jgi:hypothetical protein
VDLLGQEHQPTSNTTITETPPPQRHHYHNNITTSNTTITPAHHDTVHPAHELSNRAGFTITSTTKRTKPAKPRPNGYLVQLGTRSSS